MTEQSIRNATLGMIERTFGLKAGSTVALADFERKFSEWLIDFVEIILRDLVDFSPMQQCRKN
jgi:hypothetical protein